MMLRELVDTLRAEGIDARPYQIHHGIAVGHLPRPPVVSGRFVFGKRGAFLFLAAHSGTA